MEPTAKFFQPAWVVNYPEVSVKYFQNSYWKHWNVQADVNWTRVSEYKHAPNQPAGVKEHPGMAEIDTKSFSSWHILMLKGLLCTGSTAQMSEIRTTLYRTRETKICTLNIRCVLDDRIDKLERGSIRSSLRDGFKYSLKIY